MYYILASKYSEKPVFCVQEPALKILQILAVVEQYYACESREEHNFDLLEILEYMQEVGSTFTFEDYWSDIHGGNIAGSEEPVEAYYDTDAVIDAYAKGIEFSELCITETFHYDEVVEEKPVEAPITSSTLCIWIIASVFLLFLVEIV